MILRNWKGIAKKEYEEKYINHLLTILSQICQK